MNIVLFDMDDTLVSADTMDLWGEFLEKKGLAKEPEKQKRLKLDNDYLERKLDVTEYFEFEISLIRNIPEAVRETWRDEFFHTLIKPKISKLGLQLIENYKKNENTIVILITATLSFFASIVGEHSGVHHLIATEAEITNGYYTGKIAGVSSLGEGKLTRFKTWCRENNIIPTHTILYTDSINDLPLLNFVHKPIVVDPDQYLKKVALEKNWEMMSLK